MGDKIYLQPSRKAQRRVLLFIILYLIAWLLITTIMDHLIPNGSASLRDVERNLRIVASIGSIVLTAVFIGQILAARYLWRLGFHALKLKTFPPPGTLVIFRTRVVVGKEAVFTGYFILLGAVLLGITAIPILYGIKVMISFVL